MVRQHLCIHSSILNPNKLLILGLREVCVAGGNIEYFISMMVIRHCSTLSLVLARHICFIIILNRVNVSTYHHQKKILVALCDSKFHKVILVEA